MRKVLMFRHRRPRLKGQPINRLIPNILTVLALGAGMTAIRFGIQGKWEAAVLALMAAGVFDALDGRIARLLRGTSRFGAELDSLSDFISFGVAPAIIVYFWVMNQAGGIGWAVVLLFSICCALRLARFNIKAGESDLPPWAYNYFTGVPAPAGAAMVVFPMVLSFEFGPGIFDRPEVVGPVIVAAAVLEVSPVPTFSFKQFKVPHKFVVPSLVLVGLLAASLAGAPWATCIAVMTAYLISIPLAIRSFRKLKKAAAEIQAQGLQPVKTEPPKAGAAE